MTETPLFIADLTLRVVAMTLLLLTAAALARDQAQSLAARFGALLAASAAAYAVRSAPGFPVEPQLWHAPLVAVAGATPVLFWLFMAALFDDDFRFRPAHTVAWLALATLSVLQCMVWSRSPGTTRLVGGVLLTLAPLALAALAVVQSLSSWQADLVEKRRRLRLFILGAATAHIVVSTLANGIVPRFQAFAPAALIDAAALAAIAVVVAWNLLRSPASSLFSARAEEPAAETAPPLENPAPAASDEAGVADMAPPSRAATDTDADARIHAPDPALIAALARLMTVDEVYRQEALSIGSLADQLGVPEYKLRRQINQGLGFRNFNTFVNGFRLAAAKQVLADPAQQGTAVLTIAMDCGFQSLGPFNRAFKADTGMTPTEYRRTHVQRPASQAANEPLAAEAVRAGTPP